MERLQLRSEEEWVRWLEARRDSYLVVECVRHRNIRPSHQPNLRWRIVGMSKGVTHDDGRNMVERRGRPFYTNFSNAYYALCRIAKHAQRICRTCAHGRMVLREGKVSCSNLAVLTTVMAKSEPVHRYTPNKFIMRQPWRVCLLVDGWNSKT